MEPFRTVTGPAAPLDRPDVDTDQIIPKQFLKRVAKSGYGDVLFHDWRYADDGTPDPEFVLNREEYRAATILLAGRNFGCGSSREHAAWALRDFGIRAVVAPSFADIFQGNCYQNGLVPVTLPEKDVQLLMNRATTHPGHQVTVNLEALRISDESGYEASFEIDPFRRQSLLEGLDDIAITLRNEERIRAFEESQERTISP